jgi:hypothetical protein
MTSTPAALIRGFCRAVQLLCDDRGGEKCLEALREPVGYGHPVLWDCSRGLRPGPVSPAPRHRVCSVRTKSVSTSPAHLGRIGRIARIVAFRRDGVNPLGEGIFLVSSP